LITVGRGRIAPIAGDIHFVTERRETIGYRPRDSSFETQAAGNEFVRAERRIEMLGLESRRFHGFLRRHSEIDDVKQDL
jgi:hypothetical protein